MSLLADLEFELQKLQERKAQAKLPPLAQAPSAAPAPSAEAPKQVRSTPRKAEQESQEPEVKAMDPLTAGMSVASDLLFKRQGLKKRDLAYAYGAGSGGLVSLAGKGAGIAGREVQRVGASPTPIADLAERAYGAVKHVSPVAAAIGRKGVSLARDVKASTQVKDPLVSKDPRFESINALGKTLESAEAPLMKMGDQTKQFYEGLLTDKAKALKNTPWYQAEGLGAKFMAATLQAAESAPQTAVTAVVGAPIAGTLKATGAIKGLTSGIKGMGVSKKWAGNIAAWLGEGLAYSTPEGILAGLANATDVGNHIEKMTHEDLQSSVKYMEYFKSLPADTDPEQKVKDAKKLLIRDAEVYALGSTAVASMVTGMVAGGGMFGSAGASKSFIMRRVLGAGKEGIQEFFQSGLGEKLPANMAIKMFADPEQEVMQGVWAAGAAGAGPGAIMGGMVGSGTPDVDPMERLTQANIARNKIRDKQIRVLKQQNLSDKELAQLAESPDALAGYGLKPSDIQGMIVNKERAVKEAAEFKALLDSAPTEAIREGMRTSLLGQTMAKIQGTQPGGPRDREETKPETRQAAPETKKVETKPAKPEEVEGPVKPEGVKGPVKPEGVKGPVDPVELQKAKERVLELYSAGTKPSAFAPKFVRQEYAEKLKKAQETLAGLMKAVEPVPKVERRKDIARRKTVDEMSPEEMKKELLINDLTNIPNKRALKETVQRADEEGKPKTVIFIDADSLKYVNDFGGHEAGDNLLKAIADTVKSVDPDLGFHISGDEFVILADNPKQAKQKAKALEKALAGKEIVFTLDTGEEYVYSGLGASYGIAQTVAEADKKMGLHKLEREEAGARAERGAAPPGLRKVDTGKGKVGPDKGQKVPRVKEKVKAAKVKAKPTIKVKTKAEAEKAKIKADKVRAKTVETARLKVEAKRAEAKAKAEKIKAKAAAKPAPKVKAKTTIKVKAKKKAAGPKTALNTLETKLQSVKFITAPTAYKKAANAFLKNAEPIPLGDRELPSLELEQKTLVKLVWMYKSAKKIKAIQARLDVVRKAVDNFGKPKASADENAEFKKVARDSKDAKTVVKWMAENSENESFREIAKRIIINFPKVALTAVRPFALFSATAAPPDMSTRFGLHRITAEGTQHIFLRDTEEKTGMNEQTFLHEAVHAVTVAKIVFGMSPEYEGTKLRKAVNDLLKLQKHVLTELKAIDRENLTSAEINIIANLQRILKNPRELVTYGMTDPRLQKLMEAMPYKGKTAWSAFVETIRNILGLKEGTALGELIRITDDIITQESTVPVANLNAAEAKLRVESEQKVLDTSVKSEDPEVRKVAQMLKKINTDNTAFKRTAETQTISTLERVFGLPEFTYMKDNAANRVLQVALKADELKYTTQTAIAGEFAAFGDVIQRVNPEAYTAANDYILQTDKDGVGFGIKFKAKKWNVIGLAGEVLREGLTEADAITGMMNQETMYLQKRDYDLDAISIVRQFRELTNRAFDVQVADLRQQIETAKRYGLEEPRVGDKNTLTLAKAIDRIGDLRGTYFPRERQNKTYIVRASKENEDSVLLTFDGYFPENTASFDTTNRIKEVLNAGLPIGSEIKDLQAKGYTVTGPTLSPNPTSEVYEVPKLVASLDAILKLAEDSTAEADLKAIQHLNNLLIVKMAEMFHAKGAMGSKIHRVEKYVTGFEPDVVKAAMSHVQRVTASVVTREIARDMILAFSGRDISFQEFHESNPESDYGDYRAYVFQRGVHPTKQAALYKNLKEYMQYMLTSNNATDRVLGYMKATAVLMYLGGRVSSAAVNLTNMVMAVPATLSAHAGISIKDALEHISNASTLYVAYRSRQIVNHGGDESSLVKAAEWLETKAQSVGKTLTVSVNLTPEDFQVFNMITELGWDAPLFNTEAIQALQGYAGKRFDQIMAASMYMFSATEKANRAMTIFAAYTALKPKFPELSMRDVLEKAKHTSDRSHGLYSKATKPFAVQKYRGLDLFYTFLKFSHTYLLNMVELGIKYKNIKAATYMLLIPSVLAGVGANLATPVVVALAKMFGFNDDLEEDVHAWCAKYLPPSMQKMVRHGFFGLMNLNFKGSLQMGNPFPTKLEHVTGAPGQMILDTWDAAKLIRQREYYKGIEKVLPTFLETPMKGYRYHTEGVSTPTYGPVFHGKEQLKATETELFMMMLSFNTANLSGIREKQWGEKQVRASFAKDRQDIIRRMKHLTLSKKASRAEVLADIQEDLDKYNQRVERASARYQLEPLTLVQLERYLKRSFKPSKFERQRNVD